MIAIKAISSLSKLPQQGYILADSWYSVEKIIKASLKNGFEYVGDLKINCVIYPKDYGQKLILPSYSERTILIIFSDIKAKSMDLRV